MKITFDGRYLTSSASGVGNYCENLIRAMLSLDPKLEVKLIARTRGAAARFETDRCKELIYDAPPRSLRTLYALPRKLDASDSDLFHGPFNILPSGVPLPTLVTIHDLMQIQSPANIATSRFVRHTAGLFWRTRIRHAARHARRILAVSETTRNAVLEHFPERDPSSVTVTPNGTDPYFLAGPTPDELEKAAALIGHSQQFVLCVGNESPHKNHLRGVKAFVQAFGDRDDISFVLVRRSIRHDADMVALLREPRTRARVVVLGQVDKPALRALYHLAAAFFFPSWIEGFGMPILEAMASGCPVLTSDRSAPAEVAGSAALLASPYSIDEMAHALGRIVSDQPLRERLVRAGKKRVSDYTWEGCARLTLDAYRDVITPRRAEGGIG